MNNFIYLKLLTCSFKNDFDPLINYSHLSIKIAWQRDQSSSNFLFSLIMLQIIS